ncbi:MAG: thioredoxin family protein [Bacteroidota bacterium]|nr:thioredoxin family protein [Bacteroidota bacterium]
MKRLLVLSLAIVCMSFISWQHNLQDAKQLAKKEHKHILLNFSGSDWCGPCIRLHKEIFGSDEFQKFADSTLVLVNADFPRSRKNQLPSAQQKINDAIADQYNTQGSFPLTVLLNEDGKVIKEWEGFPKTTIDEFIEDIKSSIDTDK